MVSRKRKQSLPGEAYMLQDDHSQYVKCFRVCTAVFFLLIFLLLPVSQEDAQADGNSEKKLTLMIYMCGSNLESGYGAASADIMEMIEHRPEDPQVSVLLMTGGSSRWMNGISDDTTTIFEINHRGIMIRWTGADDGTVPMNMASGETLAFFLDYCCKERPAEEYALILWDHGGGPMAGVCWDENYAMESLSLLDVSEAIQSSHIGKLSWIGFDACMMSSFEVACTLSSNAYYMIASQDTEPATGWNYAFLQDLGMDENGAETGQRIVDAYFQQENSADAPMTLSCIDLNQMTSLKNAMDRFFGNIVKEMDDSSFAKLSGMRMQASGFGKSDPSRNESGYDLVDLLDLISVFSDTNGDEVKQALEKAVICNRSNRDGTGGLSIYHPYFNKKEYTEAWHDMYQRINSSPEYANYIFQFGELLTEEERTDWSGLRIKDEGDGIFTCALTEEQSASLTDARLLVLRDDGLGYVSVGDYPASLDENGMLRGVYHGGGLYAVSQNHGKTDLTGPVSYYLMGDHLIWIPVAFMPKDGSTLDPGMLVCSIPEEAAESAVEVQTVLLYDDVLKIHSPRIEFRPEKYSVMYFSSIGRKLPAVSDRGTMAAYKEWPSDDGVNWEGVYMDSEWSLRCFGRQLDGDQLYTLFQITDVQQNTFSSSLAPVKNQNITEMSGNPCVYETEDFRMEMKLKVLDAAKEQGLIFDVSVTNRMDIPLHCSMGVPKLNGIRYLDNSIFSKKLQPGETVSEITHISFEELIGMEEIHQVAGKLSMENEAGEEIFSDVYSFSIPQMDVSSIAPEKQVMVSGEMDGIRCELIRLWMDESNGNINMKMLITNNTQSEKFISEAGINHLQTGCSDSTRTGPEGEKLVTLSFRNAVTLTSSDRINVGDIISYERELVLIPQLFLHQHMTHVEDISLMFSDYNTLVLRLDEPWPIPVFHMDDPDRFSLVTSSEHIPDEPEKLQLFESTQFSVYIQKLFFADNGFAAILEIENRSDEMPYLDCDGIEINGTEMRSYVSIGSVIPGHRRIYKITFPLDSTNASFTEIQDLKLKFSWFDMSTISFQEYAVLLKPGKSVKLGTKGGMMLECNDLEAEYMTGSIDELYRTFPMNETIQSTI